MKRLQVGARLESLGVPFRRALAEAERLGVKGVQFDALGELSPTRLTQTGRREILHLFRSHNLELTALGCPLRRGLDAPEDHEGRIEHVRQVLTLSAELGARLVIAHAGMVPPEPNHPAASSMIDAVRDVAAHGDRIGAVVAFDTGLEAGAAMDRFLSQFDTGSLGANLNPGKLLMNGFDPIEAARALATRVKHVRASDARSGRPGQEVALGAGDIDWMQFLGVLEEIEYRGWINVGSEVGIPSPAQVAAEVAFLRRLGV